PGHEVQTLRGSPRPDELRRVIDAEKVCNPYPGRLICFCGARRELVQSTVHVGVVPAVESLDRLDDRARLLAGRGAVEIDEPVAVDLLLQNGEEGSERRCLLILVGVEGREGMQDRKSTRLNSSHVTNSYAVCCV